MQHNANMLLPTFLGAPAVQTALTTVVKVSYVAARGLYMGRLAGERFAKLSLAEDNTADNTPSILSPFPESLRDRAKPDPRRQNEKNLISELLTHFKQTSEVRQYLKYFGSVDSPDKFAIIRFSGDVLNNREHLAQTASALSFLQRVGLLPIVVHGAGLFTGRRSQNVDQVAQSGTAEAALQAAQHYMEAVNAALVAELRMLGVEAAPLREKVFGVTAVDSSTTSQWAGITGAIESVDMKTISVNIKAGRIPVVASMGRVAEGERKGSVLTFSTWDATTALAKKIQPLKVIMLRPEGNLCDENGEKISRVTLTTDYDHLMGFHPATPSSSPSPTTTPAPSSPTETESAPRLCARDKQELQDIKSLFEVLKPGTTVAVTNPANLAKELFTHKGAGTLVSKGEQVWRIPTLKDPRVDTAHLASLLEEVFKAKLAPAFMPGLPDRLWQLYLAESYRGVAVVTKGPRGIAYLDKFAVHPTAQGDKLGELVWQAMVRNEKKLFWRSRSANPVNAWYFEQAHGAYKAGYWTVFWRGLNDEEIMECVKDALSYPATFAPKSAPLAGVQPGFLPPATSEGAAQATLGSLK
eukprot:comp23989_c0_seq1/m.42636 comp23989_c0_seq1/g.42636  ORF comp23989_c0_seq1/g.42636 comp23989_c0_seq1/m.42636 type:complete len:582 (-) comp23989_c0_seq1:332-2077(-)